MNLLFLTCIDAQWTKEKLKIFNKYCFIYPIFLPHKTKCWMILNISPQNIKQKQCDSAL